MCTKRASEHNNSGCSFRSLARYASFFFFFGFSTLCGRATPECFHLGFNCKEKHSIFCRLIQIFFFRRKIKNFVFFEWDFFFVRSSFTWKIMCFNKNETGWLAAACCPALNYNYLSTSIAHIHSLTRSHITSNGQRTNRRNTN